MNDRELYLGTEIDGRGRIVLDMDHLTTHAVCLGMTGSGKTGLGIVALEELAGRGVPLLVIDLKGDMVDLLLNFPELDAESFGPWLPTDQLEDRDPTEVAREQAEKWRQGLERSGLGPSRFGSRQERCRVAALDSRRGIVGAVGYSSGVERARRLGSGCGSRRRHRPGQWGGWCALVAGRSRRRSVLGSRSRAHGVRDSRPLDER